MFVSDYRNVTLTSGFWKAKEDLNRDVTIDAVYNRFDETGRIKAFKCDWKEGDPQQPHFFWDSDVAKWMEGAAYVLQSNDRPDLTEKVEWLIDQIEKNQGEDGYFNIYFTVVAPEKRFTTRDWHELYCAGHLMEAACAYYQATGKDRMLKLMEKYADYIYRVFVDEKSANFTTPGHEEIELALYRMYKTTGKQKYLDLCEFFLENRGQPDNNEAQIFDAAHYAQSHAPIREQHEAFGHSVRATYLYSGMADLAGEKHDEALLTACRDLFDDITKKKMYVTGGIGSTNIGEAFTIPYDLPNAHAYTETCASIGMMFFGERMFRIDPEHPSKYHDTVELEMYNGALSGLSLSGEEFFYENPLEINLVERTRITATKHREHWPITQRVKVFGCSCCPPNINRVLSSMGTYFYTYDDAEGAVYVNQFGTSVFEKDGVKVSVETEYPLNGLVKISSNAPVCVRIPAWCRRFKTDRPHVMVNGYAKFDAGEITVEFEMKTELIAGSVNVVKNLGKCALRRGPIVYCAEGIDNGGDVHTLYLDRGTAAQAELELCEKCGCYAITLKGFRRVDVDTDSLYTPLEENYIPADIRMIPYHAFANRGETDMLVWMNYR